MRIQNSVRLVLGVCAFFLLAAALNVFARPHFTYEQGDTRISITYSHLWRTECFEMIWTTQGIESIHIAGEGTVGEGQRTFCDHTYEPTVTIQISGATRLDYRRDMLWLNIQTYVWLAALSLGVALFWPRHRYFWAAASLVLIGLMLWLVQGAPPILLHTFLLSVIAITPLARVFVLAIFVPLVYWLFVPAAQRIPFLLGVGVLTLLAADVTLEYLVLLGVLIAWLSCLGTPSDPTQSVSSGFVALCGLVLVGLTAAVLAKTLSPSSLSLLPVLPVIGVFYAILTLAVLWHIVRFPPIRSLMRGVLSLVLIVILLQGHLLAQTVSRISDIIPMTSVLLMMTALILMGFAFRIGPYLTSVQRRWLTYGGIILLLVVFVVFKVTAMPLLGWFGFSYIAFRLLHVLLEHRQNSPLPSVSAAQLGLYSTFFSAQSVGPIALLPQFGPQMQTVQTFSWNDYGEGWQRILWGAIKKFFVADVLLAVIFPSTIPITFLTTPAAWVQLYAYAFYIYLDFSGFIHIALGLAQLVGYRLPENFDRPYTKGSLAQFWQSWHITLSNWVRTYVYLPLSRALLRTRLKRSSLLIVFIANLVTMILIGLWHGFTLNFVLWGVWHAVGLLVHKAFADRTRRQQIKWRGTWRARAFHLFSVGLTFHVVILSWVFFMFPTFNESLTFLAKLGGLS